MTITIAAAVKKLESTRDRKGSHAGIGPDGSYVLFRKKESERLAQLKQTHNNPHIATYLVTMSKKRSAPDPDLIWTNGEVQGVISNHKAKNQQLVACNRRQLELIEHLQLQLQLPRCPPNSWAAQSNAKLAKDLAGSEKMVLRQAQRIGELEEALLARGAAADALARITTLEGAIAQAETAARVDYQHYCQQESELRLQIKSLTERKDDIFKNGLAMYNQITSLRQEQGELNQVAQAEVAASQASAEAAQAATAAAQAATAVAQVEAAADRANAVRICTALAGTDAHADRTCYTQRAEILRLTAQLEAAREYISPEFAADADEYIREQAQEAVDYVINARKEQELQEAAGGRQLHLDTADYCHG
jgi:hypothetical protein